MSQEASVILERYELGPPIGEGGMGEVFRGLDRETGETVAIKRLKSGRLANDPTQIERFEREGDALRVLDHPNIVKVLASGSESGDHYIVMELVAGGSLADLLSKEERLPIARTIDIALELADALTRSHHLKIVHRDIKPGNVLLAKDGTPRLTDFGVARIGESTFTGTGNVIGTYGYISPEAFQGHGSDTRGDIWAFGVLLYEMVAGRRPFAASEPAAEMMAILKERPPELDELRPEIPIALVDLVDRMLEKEPQQRIPSMRRVGAELE